MRRAPRGERSGRRPGSVAPRHERGHRQPPVAIRRPRSPSGVMLASIDSPQGDQADATAPDRRRATEDHEHASRARPGTGWGAPAADAGGRPGASRPAPRRAPRARPRSRRATQRGKRRATWSPRPRRGPAAVDEHEVRGAGNARSPPRPAEDITTGTPAGASARRRAGLLAIGAAGHDHRLHAGGQPLLAPSASQNARAACAAAEVRNASRVGGEPPPSKASVMASPVGRRPG